MNGDASKEAFAERNAAEGIRRFERQSVFAWTTSPRSPSWLPLAKGEKGRSVETQPTSQGARLAWFELAENGKKI